MSERIKDTADGKFHLWIDGASTGPFTRADILSRRRAGTLDGETLCAAEGDGDWQAVKTLTDFDAISKPAAREEYFWERPTFLPSLVFTVSFFVLCYQALTGSLIGVLFCATLMTTSMLSRVVVAILQKR